MDYEKWLAIQRIAGRASSTIATYRKTLTQFTEYMSACGITELQQITSDDLIDWQLSRVGLAPATRSKEAAIIAAWLRWAAVEGLVAGGLPDAIIKPRIQHRPGRTLTAEQVSRLLAACDDDDIGIRDRAIISILVDTGLRASEACAINVGDVDHQTPHGEPGRIRIERGKGGGAGTVWCGELTKKYLADWLMARQHYTDENSLLIGLGGTRPGTRLTRGGLFSIVERRGQQVGLVVSPHDLRRTFAVLLVESGSSSRQIQLWGRWQSLAMVERYTATYEAGKNYLPHSPIDNISTR